MALNKSKTDPKLGLEIENKLQELGIHTPTFKYTQICDEDKLKTIESAMRLIMETLSLDLKDDSLKDTPKRVAKMYMNEIFWGLEPDNFPKITVVDNKMNYDELVIETGIQVSSYCEHHFVAIDGEAIVGYKPGSKVLGLSKINRVVEYFSRRPQIQERLTEQIYHSLVYILGTDDVAVLVNAKHFCVKSRGVEHTNCSTITSKLGGIFRENATLRNEFMSLIKR